ncbi:MAG: hypothetical protein ABSC92_00395 [Rhizomicrobium sp.]|jgi:hypothetical protein
MLGHLVHTRDSLEDAPAYFPPRSESWMRRAWRAVFGRRAGH